MSQLFVILYVYNIFLNIYSYIKKSETINQYLIQGTSLFIRFKYKRPQHRVRLTSEFHRR